MNRKAYAVLVVITVIAGLAVHFHGIGLGASVRDVLGDALWGAMILWLVSLAAPNTGILPRGTVALAICFAVELSQQLEHPVLQALRSSTFGHIVLGSDFDARDLIAYAAGIAAALLADKTIIHTTVCTPGSV